MQKILFLAVFALLAQACTTNVKPQTNTIPPPADASGQVNQAQQGAAFSITTDAFYQASLKSSTSKGRLVSLYLNHEGGYKMSTDFMDNSEIKVDTGQWRTLENGNLSLNHRRAPKRDTMMLEFQTDGDKLIYLGKEYGTAGLTLWVKPLPQ